MNTERYAYQQRFPNLDISIIDQVYKTDPKSADDRRNTIQHLENPKWFWIVSLYRGLPVCFGIFEPVGSVVHVVELHTHGGTPPSRQDSAQGKGLATTTLYLGLQQIAHHHPQVSTSTIAVDSLQSETHPRQWYQSLGYQPAKGCSSEWSLGGLQLTKVTMHAPLATVLARLRPKTLVA